MPAAINPDCQIDLRFFNPPDEFEGCFTAIYRANLTVPGGGLVADYLQPGWGSLRFSSESKASFAIPGAQALTGTNFPASGPSSKPVRFEIGTARMWGVGLFPLGWARFIGLPASEFADRAVDGMVHPAFSGFSPVAHDLFRDAPDDEAEFASLIKVFRSLARPVREEQMIRAVHDAIVDTEMASVAQLACRAGLTARQLERLCRRYFGFPPKLLLRRQRLMRTVAAYMVDPGSTWSSVIDGRYHDQAHFVREFQQFFLMTPSEYASLGHPVMAAFMTERKRVLGAPTQFMDRP